MTFAKNMDITRTQSVDTEDTLYMYKILTSEYTVQHF